MAVGEYAPSATSSPDAPVNAAEEDDSVSEHPVSAIPAALIKAMEALDGDRGVHKSLSTKNEGNASTAVVALVNSKSVR
ncbi:hypothetical protein ACQX25_07535 [Corynebacterium diphtheriae]|uniref:hypothetical protein n=1 Tax=Corynebacterium diphtheriae TaxID=1717 RepID=UPI0002F7DD98|nr:hypothetical protein [Corynebacterium diphtheriae]CAB1022121.1 hypothetical protein FRC0529_01916 [Corynebacterium diphtheriae]